MRNFIKVLSISVLTSTSFMTQAMDDLEAEAKMWGFGSVAAYLDQMGRENEFSQPQPQPQPSVISDKGMKDSLRLAQELQAQEDKMNRLASTKQDPEERARQMKEDQELALKMSQGWEPKAHAPKGFDPDLEATERLILQLTGQEPEQVLSDRLLPQKLEGKDKSDSYLEASLQLVYQLQGQIDPRGVYNLPYLKQKVTPGDIIAYEIIVAAAKTIKVDADVHTMTHRFARPHYAETKRLEQTYLGILPQPNKLLTLAEMKTDLESLAKRNEDVAKIMPPILELFTNAAYLPAYWNVKVDGETGLDIREVMSNCFTLAQAYGDGALANLAIILADNRQTGGGCHPGVTGRLAHTFFTEVSAAIGRG